MTHGSSRIFAWSNGARLRRRAWLLLLLFYAFGAGIDIGRHLAGDLRGGDGSIETAEVAVAVTAGLFWPIDLVAMILLVGR